jgi:hypothetical protein
LSNPYKISQIVIYFITRDFSESNLGSFTRETTTDDRVLAKYEQAKAVACLNPTDENLAAVEILYIDLQSTLESDTFYYKEAVPVATFGTSTFPAWLDTGDPVQDAANAATWHITPIDEDAASTTQYGHFELEWSPVGQREGDYFICWTWTPLPGGDSLSQYLHFALSGDTQVTTSIPTHFTKQSKYETLLNRYIPEVFKAHWASNDLSPEVIQEFNNAVAQGFTLLEDLVNQSVDLLDVNATHEAYIVYLANLFNLKLRSHDPTLWRRQVKRAIPVFKKKGTYRGLAEALAQAGVQLKKFTKLWQVISSYTWQELFDVITDNQTDFTLSKVAVLPIDLNNFELYYRGAADDTWTTLTVDYIQINNIGGISILTWVGNLLSVNPIMLQAGDSIRIVYEVSDVPGPAEQILENYIRALPLMDQRDERDQDYPPKNWNVRLIEEDDSFFDIIIPTRHPYADPLIFGWVRTEFPYSENIYNMEEYNGSTRESRNPCDIDKDFIDPCKACQSSKYNINLQAEQLSDDRIREVLEILDEYTPFHAVLHQVNFEGLVNEFVEPPVETVEKLIQFSHEDLAISGNAQMFFNRVMEDGLHSVKRDELATAALVAGAVGVWVPATAYNDSIVLYCPDIEFDTLGWGLPADNILEILTGPYTGIYTCSNRDGHMVIINGIPIGSEPLSASSFNFRLSIDLYHNNNVDITQEFAFDDLGLDIEALWDETNPDKAYDQSWTLDLPAYPYPDPPPMGPNNSVYQIIGITQGKMLIDEYAHPFNTLPAANTLGITYTIHDSLGHVVASGTTGRWTQTTRAIVDFSSELTLDDVRSLFQIGQYVLYAGTQYEIQGFITNDNHRLYISNYALGDAGGVTVDVHQRTANNQIGYLQYRGMILQTAIDYEAAFGMINGVNAPVDPNLIVDSNLWMESFLVVIHNLPPHDDDYYAIAQIDGTIITLNGPHNVWKTLAAGGTPVDIHIYQYTKQPLTIKERLYPPMPEQIFDFVDHRGNDVVMMNIETATPFLPFMAFTKLTDDSGNKISESVNQNESVTFSIEYKEESTTLKEKKELLQDKEAWVRMSAIHALGEMGPEAKSAISAIKELLQDENKWVCIAAAEALKKIEK